jgi:hypothetical protein
MCASHLSSFSFEKGEQGEFFYKKNRYSSKFCQVTYSYRLKFLLLLVSQAGLRERASFVLAGQATLDPLPVFEEDKEAGCVLPFPLKQRCVEKAKVIRLQRPGRRVWEMVKDEGLKICYSISMFVRSVVSYQEKNCDTLSAHNALSRSVPLLFLSPASFRQESLRMLKALLI